MGRAASPLAHLAPMATLETYQQVLAHDTAHTGPDAPVAGVAHVGMAEVAYQRGDLDAARYHASEGIARCRQFVYTQALATGLSTLVRIRHAEGDPGLASTRDDPDWSETLRIGREDMPVTIGFIGVALIMAVAALADLDAQGVLYTCVAAGLVAVAAVSFYATANHGPATRVLMSAAAVLGAVIVVGENTF